VDPRSKRLRRERRFSPQPRRHLQLDGVILGPDKQVRFLPTLPLQFLSNILSASGSVSSSRRRSIHCSNCAWLLG
jgi:hypothetical protein